MNRVMRLFFGAALLGTTISASAADIAGNVTLASDYRFRGVSQLKGQFSPAIQGGFDFATDIGFYIGTWASNVNFSGGAIETDVYGGFKGAINEDVAYDIGVLYYGYPHDNNNGNTNLPYTEVYGSLTFKGVKFGLNYSDDYFAESGKFYYPYVEYAFDPIENLTLSFHYGYNKFDENQVGLDNEDYYQDWKIQAATKWLGVTWALAYVDTDLDDDKNCYGDKDLCAATAVVSISKSL
jgi:uncharacterized protein (TIGR02001 family)